MIDLGTVKPGATIRIPFSSFDKDDGSSITMTNYAAADILVYKDGGTTERASTAGFTATTDFDAKTGKHLAVIDLADNTTADFFKAGSEYLVAIDAVTVDAVTTGGWIARFRIGYQGAVLDTFLATLTSQTSFTLNEGPAEDNALNDMWAVIHDVASKVQHAMVQILDYTGASKTVTLAAGATFTVAAGDNISVMGMMPMQPATLGRRPVVDAAGLVDANTVKVGPTGAGTAQTAGDVIADTNDIQSRLPAALVGGRMDSSVGAMAAAVLDAAAIAADALTAAKVAADVSAEIADAVWDEAIAGHLGVGSTGEKLNAAGAAGDPWATALPGAYGAGTAGKIVGDNLNATVSSRATQTSVDTVDDLIDTEIATILAGLVAIETDTQDIQTRLPALLVGGRMDSSVGAMAADVLTAAALAADAANELRDAIFARAYSAAYGALTFDQLTKLAFAVLLGKASGLETTTATYRNLADTADSVVATVDADGNRSAVTLTP